MLEGPRLFIDASTADIQVGVWGGRQWQSFLSARGDALTEVFHLTQRCLEEAATDIRELRGFILGVGPGSLLGLRLSAMAIEGWRALPESPRELHTCDSLRLAAACLANSTEGPFTLLSPFQKGWWNAVRCAHGGPGERELLTDAAVADLPGPLLALETRLQFPLPPPMRSVRADLRALAELPQSWQLMVPVERPEIIVPRAPEFSRWSAERHR